MIQHTDCRFPDDVDPVLKGSGEKELSCGFLFHSRSYDIHYHCTRACLEAEILSELPVNLDTAHIHDSSSVVQGLT